MKLSDLHPWVETWEIPDKAQQALAAFFPTLVRLENEFGSPLIITSGFRTWAQHKAIYQKINDARKLGGKDQIPIPLHSAHLSGQAVDISDPDKRLQRFLEDEIFLTDNGLWAEDFKSTLGWAHLQSKPYGSWVLGGTRFFKP